jgi:hypothetical protein
VRLNFPLRTVGNPKTKFIRIKNYILVKINTNKKMKNRIYPTNPDCPLSETERVQLGIILDRLEWEAYAPLRHLTSAWADAIVTDYDEFEIQIDIKSGVDSLGKSYEDGTTIERSKLDALSV